MITGTQLDNMIDHAQWLLPNLKKFVRFFAITGVGSYQ